jgi:hypothetical protein
MKLPDFNFVDAGSVRRAVVDAGDIRADVAFQNDINVLLALLDERVPPLQALGWVQQPLAVPAARPPAPPARPGSERGLHALAGGAPPRAKAIEAAHRPAVAAVARTA